MQIQEQLDMFPSNDLVIPDNYILVNDEAKFEQMIDDIADSAIIGFDTETEGLDFTKHKVFGICIWCHGPDRGYFIDRRTDEGLFLDTTQQVWNFADDETKTKVMHNAKFDMKMMAEFIPIEAWVEVEDTVFMSRIYRGQNFGNDLKGLATWAINATADKWEKQVLNWFAENKYKTKNDRPYHKLPVNIVYPYGIADTELTVKLYFFFEEKFQSDDAVGRLRTYRLYMELLSIVAKREYRGIKIDVDYILCSQSEMEAELEILLAEIREDVLDAKKDNVLDWEEAEEARIKEEVIPEKQQEHLDDMKFRAKNKILKIEGEMYDWKPTGNALKQFLFQDLGIESKFKTAKGGDQVNEEALKIYALDWPVCSKITRLREFDKLKGTYADNIVEGVDEKGFIHPQLNTGRAATNRWSSSNPNMQNIPVRGAEAKRIRGAFVPPKDSVITIADWSKQEARMFAHCSQDPKLLQIFNEGLDPYCKIWADINGWDYDEFIGHKALRKLHDPTPEQVAKLEWFEIEYHKGKTLFLGIQYRMGKKLLAQKLNEFVKLGERMYTVTDATKILDKFFEVYHVCYAFLEEESNKVKNQGYQDCIYGFRRYIEPDKFYTQAVNTLIQGTCAEMANQLIVQSSKLLEGRRSSFYLQVHDEVQWEMYSEDIHLLTKFKELGEDHPFNPPPKLGFKYYDRRWSEVTEIENLEEFINAFQSNQNSTRTTKLLL